MKASLDLAAGAGKIRKERVEVFAHMLLAALVELALLIARAENPQAAALSGTAALTELLDRLFATSPWQTAGVQPDHGVIDAWFPSATQSRISQ